ENGGGSEVRSSGWGFIDCPTVAKVIAAFFAGLVIVMGAALLSSRAHQISDPAPAKRLVKQPQTAATPIASGAPRSNQSSLEKPVRAPSEEAAAGTAYQRAGANMDSAGPTQKRET